MNIFTSENVAKYSKAGSTERIGEYVLRNGVWSMSIGPAPFWNGTTDSSILLTDEFHPNTQYIIDLWMDADDVINSSGVYRPCGVILFYTDGTVNNTGSITGAENRGFQHIVYVTDPNLSVRGIHFEYSIQPPVYFRADSFISPLNNNTKIVKTGIVTTGEMNEQITVGSNFSAKLGKGFIETQNFIEI